MSKMKEIDACLRLNDEFTPKLDEATKRLQSSHKTMAKLAKKFDRVGKSITKAGKSMTTKVTAPIVAVGAAAVKTAAEFEAGMSKVQAISGATGSELEQLTEKAKEMGAKTKFSASESADAFSYMAMAGWKTEDMLSGIEGVMYLAGATGEDLATTSDIVTDALTALNMKADETNRFVDALAAAANNSNTNVSMLGESFKYVAPVAGSLGYNIEDVSVALGLMANNGIKASSAGTAMRSLLTNMAKPSKSAQAAMDKLGLSLTDASGKMKPLNVLMGEMRESFSGLTEKQKAQYAASLAGKTGMSGLLAIVNSSQDDFDKLTDAINNSNGAAKEMYEIANNNLTGKLTVLKSTVESAAISIGNKLTPYVEKLTAFIQKLADKFNSLDDKQLDTIIKLAAVAAAIGPVLLMVGKLTTGIGKCIKVASKIAKGEGILGKIFGKIGLKGLAVIALLTAIALFAYLIIKNWDKIKAFFIRIWEKIKEIFGKIKDKIVTTFTNIKEKIKDFVTNAKSKITEIIVKVSSASGYFGAIIEGIRGYINGIKTIFSGIIQFIKGVFTGNWKGAWEGVKKIFSGIFQSFTSIVKTPINAVIGLINDVIEKINGIGLKLPDWLPGSLGGKDLSFNIPKIPQLYKGTNYFSGGSAVIHDKGGEIVDLPRGTRVIPHDRSVSEAYESGKKKASIYIAKLVDTLVVREEADIDRIAEALATKLEKVAVNM